MPTTSSLVVTVGAANANAYVDLTVADQYHLDRPPVGTTWADATAIDREKAIIWATKLLDAMYIWFGSVVDGDQALLWPRHGLLYRSGYFVPSDIIPTELQEATAEFARQLLVDDLAANSDIDTQGLRSITAGPISLTFKDFVPPKVVPDVVFSLIPDEWGVLRGRQRTARDLLRF